MSFKSSYKVSLMFCFKGKPPTCANFPCEHGKCIDLSQTITKWAQFICECDAGWHGINCDQYTASKL